MKKHTSLRKAYYVSFAAMVVVPVLMVFLISLSIIRLMMQNTAVSAIESTQNAAVSSLTESVKDASLQLSHMLYVNGYEMMEIAAMTDTADAKERYAYGTRLDQLFEMAMAPKQTVLSGMIYMKDGRDTYLKQMLAIPREEVYASHWFQQALAHKNTVMIGSYDTSQTKVVSKGSQSRELVLAVVLSPDIGVDRSGRIDAVALFFRTKVNDFFTARKGRPGLEHVVILDEQDQVIFRAEEGAVTEDCLAQIEKKQNGIYKQKISMEGRMKKTSYTCIITEVDETGWKIVSSVKTSELTKDFNRVAAIVVGVTGALFLLYFSFSRFFLQNIIQPVHTMVEGLKQVEDGDLETHISPAGLSEIRLMIHSFNRMVRQLKSSIQEKEMAQEKKMEAQLRALQSQINPHFLVNTLNSIRFMAQVSKFEVIRRMAEALIKILTCSFRSNSSFYTVREELDVLDSYIYLMKIRYSDGFDYSYAVNEDCKELLMPRLVLQPIAENSIVHGFVDLEEEMGSLSLRVWREDEKLYFEIEDNGRGMTAEEIAEVFHGKERQPEDNYSIGLENVFSRLKLNFKEAAGLEIESEPGHYTRTRIRMPALSRKEEAEKERITGEEKKADKVRKMGKERTTGKGRETEKEEEMKKEGE